MPYPDEEKDGGNPEIPVKYDMRDVVFGEPIPESYMNGKKVALKGITHLVTGGLKDPDALARGIRTVFDYQDLMKTVPDFGMKMGVDWVKSMGLMARNAYGVPQQPPTMPGQQGLPGQPPELPQAGDNGFGGPQRPAPPDFAYDQSAREGLLKDAYTPFTPEQVSLKNADPFNRAMLIGGLVGDLIAHRGQNLNNIVGGFASGEQGRVDRANQQKMTAYQMASEIAKMKLRALDAREGFQNEFAQRTYLENLDSYNKGMEKNDFTKKIALSQAEIALQKAGTDTNLSPENRSANYARLADSLEARANSFAGIDQPAYINLMSQAANYRKLAEQTKGFDSLKYDTGQFKIKTYWPKLLEIKQNTYNLAVQKNKDLAAHWANQDAASARRVDIAAEDLVRKGIMDQATIKWRHAVLDFDKNKFAAIENDKSADRDIRMAQFMQQAIKAKAEGLRIQAGAAQKDWMEVNDKNTPATNFLSPEDRDAYTAQVAKLDADNAGDQDWKFKRASTIANLEIYRKAVQAKIAAADEAHQKYIDLEDLSREALEAAGNIKVQNSRADYQQGNYPPSLPGTLPAVNDGLGSVYNPSTDEKIKAWKAGQIGKRKK